MEKTALTPKQQLFVKEYLVDKNATRAAISVGYSAKTARAIGAENLTKPNISKAIEIGLKEQADKCELSAERNLRRIAEIAYHDEKARHSDVLKACELIGKHLGMFKGNGVQEPQVVERIVNEEEVREWIKKFNEMY